MKKIMAVALIVMLSGCAVAPQRSDYSLVDPQGIDAAQYQRDYNDCAALANQTDVGDRAAGGAVFGALLGAAIGAVLCGRNCVGAGAASGALGGTTGAATSGVREQNNVLRACLSGRGYQVIR